MPESSPTSWRHLGFGLLLNLSLAAAAPAQPALPELRLEEVVSGLVSPVAVTHAPGDDRLFVTLQDGRIVIVDGGQVVVPPFLDIDPLVNSGGNEQGLLSVAFHPAYAQNGLFFVDYTNTAGDTVIARYAVSGDPSLADPNSARILLTIPQTFSNHNGGQLQFGPDGYLYVGMGDGGSANDPLCAAQDGSQLLGKLLRLDVDSVRDQSPYHTVPADNPFVGNSSVRDEIWALGLRNPWRFSFDRETGDLYIGDVGQNAREEVNFQPATSSGGENYGWKVMEGNLCLGSTSGCSRPVPGCNAPEYEPPILDYDHGGGNCSITGGYVYRGSAIPGLDGAYLYGDFCSGRLWAATPTASGFTTQLLPLQVPNLTSFGEDRNGELYLARRDGVLLRLAGEEIATPGQLALARASAEVGESDGEVRLDVTRSGGSDGAVTVDYATVAGTAAADLDFGAVAGTLSWPDGDDGARTITVPILADSLAEADETFDVLLARPSGGATLGRTSTTVTIRDDDAPTGPCVPDTTTLCLNRGRFRIEMSWRDKTGRAGSGQAEELTPDTGFFWFFRASNLEVVVKVLDACNGSSPRYWVFSAGLTNVATEMTVTDTATGMTKQYRNELGTEFEPMLDTNAFATCP